MPKSFKNHELTDVLWTPMLEKNPGAGYREGMTCAKGHSGSEEIACRSLSQRALAIKSTTAIN